ncbi:Mcm10 replication factor [Babesia ovata]|uniref:Mcm10 replication factor n=1 Tax=Babesia ovata TaxID=189622 RepID=A0A2H6KF33_9APIC|nr:Mcm10 replication factor [Babesia ovata]GBE61587.1 Mcm10 replication factor [Babesia ovata]
MAARIGARLHKDGIVANGIELVIRRWVKGREEMGAIFADKTTQFAHVKVLNDSRNTDQCRNSLKLGSNVDMAIICTVTAVHAHSGKGGIVTIWTCSDLQDTALKVAIYGSIPVELNSVSQGSVIAVLNPDLNDHARDYNYRSISIKHCDNVLLIGEVDGLKFCQGVTAKGASCKNLVYTHHQGDFCKFHLKAAFAKPKPNKKMTTVDSADMLKTVHERLENNQKEAGIEHFVFKPAEPPHPTAVLSKLAGLNSLVHKVTQNRMKTSASAHITVPVGVQPNKGRPKDESINRTKEFEAAVRNLKSLMHAGQKESKKILGLLQLIAKYIHYVDRDAARKSPLLKICSDLLEHPVDGVAIESLKLRREFRRILHSPIKDNSTPTYLVEVKRPEGKQVANDRATDKDLDIIMSAASEVDSYVEKENVETMKRKLVTLERMDKAEEMKKAVKEIEITASYCHDCNKWTEYPNPVCKREGHTCSSKKCKKEYHLCLEPSCGYRYFSLNGQKPPSCPG